MNNPFISIKNPGYLDRFGYWCLEEKYFPPGLKINSIYYIASSSSTFTNSCAWDQWEIDYLKGNYALLGATKCTEKLSRRSKCSIMNKANSLGLSFRGYSRPIIQYDADKNIVAEYDSIKAAARFSSVPYTTIRETCRNETWVLRHNYYWRYKTDAEDFFQKKKN